MRTARSSSAQEIDRPLLIHLGHRTEPRFRLVCVPFAGGGSGAFRPWPDDLPAWIEVVAVRLPGREASIDLAPLDRLGAVVDLVSTAVGELTADGVPYGLFGHSMGALVAYALAIRLREDGARSPERLFVAGRRGPHIPDSLPAVHRLPRPQFVESVLALGGVPAEMLELPGMLDLVVPALQADFAVCETFRYRKQEALNCPISAFGGDQDPTTTPEQLQGWRRHTRAGFRLRMYPGNHFFIGARRTDLLTDITADITTDLAGGTGQQTDGGR